MRPFLVAIIIATALLGLNLYSLFNSRLSENSHLAYWLPLTVGALILCLYVLLVSLFYLGRGFTFGLILLRQGVLLGTVAGVSLYLQGLHVLTVLDAILLVVAIVLLELFFQAEKTDTRTPTS